MEIKNSSLMRKKKDRDNCPICKRDLYLNSKISKRVGILNEFDDIGVSRNVEVFKETYADDPVYRNLNNVDDWATPDYIYNELNNEFDFNFDPCPLQHNTKKWNGLKIEWKERNFINPPYSRKLKEAFVLKAIEESKKGKLCVMLLPVSTSTKLFHHHILPNQKEIRFVYKRIKFLFKFANS